MTSLPVAGIARYERFFRAAAGLDLDKADLKRYSDFISQRIRDLHVRAVATASANGREIVLPFDLPITKGLQEQMHEFRRLDTEVGLKPNLQDLTRRIALEFSVNDETEDLLPELAGGLSLALARSFKIIDPELKNPQSVHWDRAVQLFNLLL
jgi:hypothetical protein